MNSVNLKKDNERILLVLDLDGTLLTDDKQITKTTKEYLDMACKQGVELCFATGRNFMTCKDIAIKYDLKVHLICANGAMIKDPFTSKEYYKTTVDWKIARKIAKYASRIDALIHIFTEESWFINKLERSAIEFGDKNGIKPKFIKDIKDWKSLDIIKLVLVDTPQKITQLEEWTLKKRFEIHIIRSDPYSIDITNKEASKGNGVRRIADLLGIEKENIIAVGNYYNDIDMFKVAKIGIAMGNSPDEVKRKADFVVKSNEEDGIVCLVKKFILK
ncbi:Cof-type HAD-IIB family hydrolase [Sporosalibacterium faouarense]|uniref:Cof-type HAD-IIB family hydrolase n=1 Tax=Sporosalibacterium faouarense TaxID=516123 RepID=UPI00192C5CE1|nr:Cof-type HAD-IIB family hydrolase [Sporosalibacterium faouarense]